MKTRNKKQLLIGIIMLVLALAGEIVLHTIIELDDFVSRKIIVLLIIVLTGISFLTIIILRFNAKEKQSKKKSNLSKILIISFVITIFTAYHSLFWYDRVLVFQADLKLEENIIKEFKAGNYEIDFAEVIPFEWDVAYSISIFASDELLLANTGEHYKQIRKLPFGDRDFSDAFSFLCVFKDDRMVFTGGVWYLDIYPPDYDDSCAFCYRFDRDNSEFEIVDSEYFHYTQGYHFYMVRPE